MSPSVSQLQANIRGVLARIARAAPDRPVALVAVSKTWGADRVADAVAAGHQCFGENYVQEAIAKVGALSARGIRPEWHFVGSLQSNKAKWVATHFDWFHGLTRASVADGLARHRPAHCGPLNVLIQVNISGEASKDGVSPDAVFDLAKYVAALPALRLRGVMGMAAPSDSVASQRADFARGRRAFEALRTVTTPGVAALEHIDTLSMGMSDDFEAALAEGANMVRVGSAIFGKRQQHEGQSE